MKNLNNKEKRFLLRSYMPMYKKDSCKDSFHETHEIHETLETVGDKITKEALDALRLDIELGKIVEKLDEKFPGLVVYKENKIIFTDKVQEYDVNEIFKTIFFTKVEKKETSSEQEEDEYDFNIFEVNYSKNDAIKLILNETYYMAPIHTMTLDSYKDATFTTVHNENKVQLYYQNPTGDVLGNALLVEGMELSLVDVLPRRQYQHIGPQEYKFNIGKTNQEKEKEQELASEIDQEILKNGISDFLQSMKKYQTQYPDDQATKDLIQLLEEVQGVSDGSITQGKLQTIVTELLKKIQGQAKYPKEAYDTMIKILESLDTRVDPQQLKQGISLLSTTIANYALDDPDDEDCQTMQGILNAALTSVNNAINNQEEIGKENIINDVITPFFKHRTSFKNYNNYYGSTKYYYQKRDFDLLQTIFFGTTQEQTKVTREFGNILQICDKTQTSFLADHMVYTEVINNKLTIKTLDENNKENGYQEFLNSVQETFDITADDMDEKGEINQNSEKIQKINRLYKASLLNFDTFTTRLCNEIHPKPFLGITGINRKIEEKSGIGKNILAFQNSLRDKQRYWLNFTPEEFLKPQKERRLQLHNQNFRTLNEEVEYNILTHDLTSNDDETKKRQNTNYMIAKNYHLYGEIGSNLKISLFPYYAKLADGVEGNNAKVYNNIVGLDGNISDKNAKIYGDIGLEVSIFIATTLITGGIGGVIGEGLLTLGSLSRYKNLASICQKAANAMLKTQKLQTFKTLSFGEQLGGTSLNVISKLTEARFFNNTHNFIKSKLKGIPFDVDGFWSKENIQTAVFLCLLGAGNKLRGLGEKKLLTSMAEKKGISLKELYENGLTSLQKAGMITGEVTFDVCSMLAADELMNLTFGYETIDPNTGKVITERGLTCPTQEDIVKIVGIILGSKAVKNNVWSKIHQQIKEKQWKICKTPNSDTYVFYNIITKDMIVSNIKGDNPRFILSKEQEEKVEFSEKQRIDNSNFMGRVIDVFSRKEAGQRISRKIVEQYKNKTGENITLTEDEIGVLIETYLEGSTQIELENLGIKRDKLAQSMKEKDNKFIDFLLKGGYCGAIEKGVTIESRWDSDPIDQRRKGMLNAMRESQQTENPEQMNQMFNNLLEYIKNNKNKEDFQEEICDILNNLFTTFKTQEKKTIVYNKIPYTSFDTFTNKTLGEQLLQLISKEGGTCNYRTLFFNNLFRQINDAGNFGFKNVIMHSPGHSGMRIECNGEKLYYVDRYHSSVIQKLKTKDKTEDQRIYGEIVRHRFGEELQDFDTNPFLYEINNTISPNAIRVRVGNFRFIFDNNGANAECTQYNGYMVINVKVTKELCKAEDFGRYLYNMLPKNIQDVIKKSMDPEGLIHHFNTRTSQKTLRKILYPEENRDDFDRTISKKIKRDEIRTNEHYETFIHTIEEVLQTEKPVEQMDQIFNDLLDYIKQNKNQEGFQEKILQRIKKIFSTLRTSIYSNTTNVIKDRYNQIPPNSVYEYANKSLGEEFCQLIGENGGSCRYRTVFFKKFLDEVNEAGEFGLQNIMMYRKDPSHSGLRIECNGAVLYFVDRYQPYVIEKINNNQKTYANDVKDAFGEDFFDMQKNQDQYEEFEEMEDYLNALKKKEESENEKTFQAQLTDDSGNVIKLKFKNTPKDKGISHSIEIFIDQSLFEKSQEEGYFGKKVYERLSPIDKDEIDKYVGKDNFINFLNTNISEETLQKFFYKPPLPEVTRYRKTDKDLESFFENFDTEMYTVTLVVKEKAEANQKPQKFARIFITPDDDVKREDKGIQDILRESRPKNTSPQLPYYEIETRRIYFRSGERYQVTKCNNGRCFFIVNYRDPQGNRTQQEVNMSFKDVARFFTGYVDERNN